MPRLDIKDLTIEQIKKLDMQVSKLGLKSRSDYIRLIIELDCSEILKERMRENEKIKF